MPERQPPGREAWWVAAALVLFVCLGVAYSLVVPPFEKPDEVYHYAFARHLAQGNGLPVQTLGTLGPWEHEGTQAPLYYFLVGRLTAGIDQSDFDRINRQNPHANLGNPLYPGNKNLMLYSARTLPLTGTNLALHVGRWFSLALACLSLLLVYLTARLAFPRSAPARLFALWIVAAIPQFAFISSSTSNDNLVILVSMALIYWLARLLTHGAGEPIAWWEWSVAGALLGLAALSKLQGLVLAAPIALVVGWLAWQRRSPRLFLAATVLIVLPAAAIAGWWYWRNVALYGDWLGAGRLLEINGLREEPLTWPGFVGEMRGLRYSFWGLFGWFSILLPTWIYRLMDGISIIALAGFVIAAVRRWNKEQLAALDQPRLRVQALLAFWALTLIGSMMYWATFATSSQGRLLFPALSAFAVIFVVGLVTCLNTVRRQRWAVMSLVPLLLLASSIYALAHLLPASYQAPRPLQALPSGVETQDIAYGDKVELVGVELPKGRFAPGELVPITLYLSAPRRLSTDLPLFVQLLDQNLDTIGNVTTHTGWGRNPTSLWEPNAIYKDQYLVQIESPIDNTSPLLATVYVGFAEPGSMEPLPAAHADGEPSNRMVGEVQIEAREKLDPGSLALSPMSATFEQGIRIAGVSHAVHVPPRATELPVKVLYEAAGQPNGDYTAFVHLTDSAGNQLSGHDQPPAAGRFPTHAWQAGDRILARFEIPLPDGLAPGVYQLWTGLYPSGSEGESRLGVVASDRPTKHMGVLLGTVEVR